VPGAALSLSALMRNGGFVGWHIWSRHSTKRDWGRVAGAGSHRALHAGRRAREIDGLVVRVKVTIDLIAPLDQTECMPCRAMESFY
jgi:hypothetical protein